VAAAWLGQRLTHGHALACSCARARAHPPLDAMYAYLRDHPWAGMFALLLAAYVVAALVLGVYTLIVDPPPLDMDTYRDVDAAPTKPTKVKGGGNAKKRKQLKRHGAAA
jgi:hypothetical protein